MKPSPSAIRSAPPLVPPERRGPDAILACGVCGITVDPSDLPSAVYREHDEHDQPITGPEALVFVGPLATHAECHRRLDAHPRLYAEASGDPGTFPALCGPCAHRRGRACSHPDLRANGGAGLRVHLSGLAAIICGRGGCRVPIAHAIGCDGRTVERARPE